MTRRYLYPSIAAALLLGSAAAAASANSPSVGSLCNASGQVEVLSEPSGIDCGSGPAQEMKALFKAKSQYGSGNNLDWQTRALIDARIERRIRELRKEMHPSG